MCVCSVNCGGIRHVPASDNGKVDWYALIHLHWYRLLNGSYSYVATAELCRYIGVMSTMDNLWFLFTENMCTIYLAKNDSVTANYRTKHCWCEDNVVLWLEPLAICNCYKKRHHLRFKLLSSIHHAVMLLKKAYIFCCYTLFKKSKSHIDQGLLHGRSCPLRCCARVKTRIKLA